MANKNKIKAKDVNGINVHHNGRQTVYYDNLTKKGYIIEDEDAKSFTLWEMRLPLSASLIVFSLYLKVPQLLAVVVGVVACLVSEFMFRTKFLPSLRVDNKFVKPARKALSLRFAERLSKLRLIIATVICVALVILLVVNLKFLNYTGIYLILYYILLAVSAYLLATFTMALLIKLKTK